LRRLPSVQGNIVRGLTSKYRVILKKKKKKKEVVNIQPWEQSTRLERTKKVEVLHSYVINSNLQERLWLKPQARRDSSRAYRDEGKERVAS